MPHPAWYLSDLFGGKMTENGAVKDKGKTREELKIVIVGDGGCGKTSLLTVYAKGNFPEVREAVGFFELINPSYFHFFNSLL